MVAVCTNTENLFDEIFEAELGFHRGSMIVAVKNSSGPFFITCNCVHATLKF